MKKRALIIGDLPNAGATAKLLANKGYQMSVICTSRSAANQVADIVTLPVLYGDSTLPDTLRQARMENANLAFIMLPKKEENFVAAVLCKRLLHIKKVIAVLADEKNMDDFYSAGIDHVICEVTSIANAINQQDFLSGIATLVPVSGGRVNVVEVPISETAPVAGKKIWELELPTDVIIGCILRKEQSIVPRGDTRIFAGDTLILIASEHQEIAVVQNLAGNITH